MLDPQHPLQIAIRKALTDNPLLFNGQVVPVCQFVPALPVLPCILLSQLTAVPGVALAACKTWECTVLLTVMTRFEVENQVSSGPAYAITSQVLERLEGLQLPLSDGFAMSPIKVAMLNDASDFKVKFDYLKYIRLRVKIQK